MENPNKGKQNINPGKTQPGTTQQTPGGMGGNKQQQPFNKPGQQTPNKGGTTNTGWGGGNKDKQQ
jgi:hypothetical protein